MAKISKYIPQKVGFYDFDENTKIVFNKVQKLILKNLKNVKVEHTGSTFLGLKGKNSVNILVISEKGQAKKIYEQIKDLGFQESKNTKLPRGIYMLIGSIKFRNKRYLIHVHILNKLTQNCKDILFFREYLKKNPKKAQEYENLKKKIISEGKVNHREYSASKKEFIKEILKKRRI